ncbi:MAG: hypothetical protein JW973_02875 [Bacteroidales bacterium]|nr:hypothetical protein [Bacteroidales bacterium]
MISFDIRFVVISLVMIAFLPDGGLTAQNNIKQYTEGLNIKFDLLESKKLDRAIDLLNQADVTLTNANQLYDQLSFVEKKERMTKDYQKALKTLVEASEKYKEAHSLIYSVYKAKADAFWKQMSKINHRAAGMDKAHYYEGKALKSYNRGLIRREQVMESDRYEYAVIIMNDAYKLEKLAIRDEGRAVQICVDYPVEYNYGWDDDKTLEEIVAIMRDPAINEPPEDIFATVDKESKVDSVLFKEIIFKVQIAAHTLPLSDEYLRTLYKGDLKIDMIFEDDWFKYSIGRYLSYDEAEATRRECNIKKAFVVAYQSGIHIPTQEAIKILEKKMSIQ